MEAYLFFSQVKTDMVKYLYMCLLSLHTRVILHFFRLGFIMYVHI